MYQTIMDAMQALAEAGSIFGLVNPQKGESEFQLALGGKLQEMTESDGWTWRYGGDKEEPFETAALPNEKRIKVDIVGRHPDKGMVAIELKYVKASTRRGGAPNDPPAFPYDIAKDCLRLDLLRAGHCKPVGKPVPLPIPENLQTYAIAMTDWPNYWQGSKPNWEKNRHGGGKGKTFIDTYMELIPEVIVLEAEPTGYPRAPVSKKRVWIDVRNNMYVASVTYDRRGEVWKSFETGSGQFVDGAAVFKDTSGHPAWSWTYVMVHDIQSNRMSILSHVHQVTGGWTTTFKMDGDVINKFLTAQAMQRLGSA